MEVTKLQRKCFYVDNENLKLYEKLKTMENLTTPKSDSDFFVKLLRYADNILSNKVVNIELLEQKEKEIRGLMLKLGELQGELNIYKQQAFPKKKPWYKFW